VYTDVVLLSDVKLQMYMEEPCFYILRTKFKLSYNPHSDKRCLHDVIGFSVTVVSSAKLTFVVVTSFSITHALTILSVLYQSLFL